MRKKYWTLLIIFVSTIAFSTLNYLKLQSPQSLTTYNYANIPFPSDVINNLSNMDNTPLDNQISDDGAALGRVLFYDVDLSRNRTVSCASCHQQKFSFSDTARFSRGFNGGLTSRNSMGLIHARFQRDSAFFWDNRAKYLEIQTLIPIQNSVEMGITLDTMVARLSAKPYYATLFQAAFGSPTVTSDKVSKALAQFIRSMNTFGSKFRQGVEITNGNPESTPFSNFTAQENLGKDLFMDITRGNCQACHTRNVMVQQGAQNIGLDSIYADNGVGAASGRHAQDGKFSVPSLINVALTPPYMHDGRFKTLEQVIDFYSDSIKEHVNLSGFLREILPGTIDPNNNQCDTCPPRRPHYSPTEKAALVAFLKTLNDTIITTDARWSNPFTCGTHNVQTISACENYTWNGTTYSTSGNYVYSYINSTGCVSADTLKLTIKKGSHFSSTITTCGSYNWNGTTYTSSGNYTYNYTNNLGCPSVDTLHLTINPASHITVNATACNSYTWYGTTYNNSGVYTYSYTNSYGCPSTDTLYLTLNSGSHNVSSITSCNSYVWNGTTYFNSGNYTYNYTNANGCPSTDTLHLTINQPSHHAVTVSSCDSYSWNGTTYTSSGNYIYFYNDANGCASADTLHLTINYPTHNTFYISACDSYNWNGSTYTTSGNYIYNYSNTNGCVSSDTLHLTINNTHNSSTVTACNSYNWNGTTYNASGNYLRNYTNGFGCASADTLHLTINKSSSSTTNLTICSTSLPYLWNGISCSSAGTYTKTLTNSTGCDSVATLVLSTDASTPVAPSILTQTLVSNICGARVFRYTVTAVTNATGYSWVLPTSVGGISGVYVDSGDVNSSRIIKLRYSSNATAAATDSIKVKAFSGCGNSTYKGFKLINTALGVPLAPASISITAISTGTCGNKLYRYSAPALTSATSTNAAATGYLWSFTGSLGANAIIDSGTVNSQIIRVKYTNNAAAITGDSARVLYTSDCGNSTNKAIKLTNTLLTAPAAPGSLTITTVSPYVCGARTYRYTAPVLTAATSTAMAATGYLWSFTGTLGANAVIDSGTVNSRIIRVRFTSNAASVNGDSVRVLFTSNCGNSTNKSTKLTNTLLSAPVAPTSITTTLVSDVCGARVYRYAAPNLPAATTTAGAATGYIWTLATGPVGITGTIDSGTVNSQVIKVKYTSNATATNSDSIKVKYTSNCGNSPDKAAILINTLKLAPTAPTTLTQTLVSDVCGSRVYRYTVAVVTNATGYAWTLPTSVGGVIGVAVDSGDINNDRIIKLRYTSNATALATDSIKVRAFSGCGTSSTKGFKLTNVAKSGCPTPLISELPLTLMTPSEKSKAKLKSTESLLNNSETKNKKVKR